MLFQVARASQSYHFTEAASLESLPVKKKWMYGYAGSITYIKIYLYTEFDVHIVNNSRLTASQSFQSHGSLSEFCHCYCLQNRQIALFAIDNKITATSGPKFTIEQWLNFSPPGQLQLINGADSLAQSTVIMRRFLSRGIKDLWFHQEYASVFDSIMTTM